MYFYFKYNLYSLNKLIFRYSIETIFLQNPFFRLPLAILHQHQSVMWVNRAHTVHIDNRKVMVVQQKHMFQFYTVIHLRSK